MRSAGRNGRPCQLGGGFLSNEKNSRRSTSGERVDDLHIPDKLVALRVPVRPLRQHVRPLALDEQQQAVCLEPAVDLSVSLERPPLSVRSFSPEPPERRQRSTLSGIPLLVRTVNQRLAHPLRLRAIALPIV